ncbi:VOC family protein [uncultured Phenylobacterium sp.]|uniref:VOC family protein n=1 Tax=uncultured Phenylobacterium sp. TaxID=349273 RepID=UPI0025D943E1|nr:VOC family protein [uncultured Phenylobacterium sp.]
MVSNSPIGSADELSAQLVTELPVRSLAESLSFYRAAGFKLARATADFGVICWGERYLLLAERAGVSIGPNPANIRIIVADVDALFARAGELGWRVRHPLADRGYGLRDFTVLDPDGYELRFAALA